MGIEERGPHQYLVRIRRQGFSIARTFETRQAAERFHAEKLAEIMGDRFDDGRAEKETTLRDLLERYLREETPKKKGAKQEADRIRVWMKEPIALLPSASIKSRHIAEWRNRRQKEGVAPSTINNSMNLLSSVFRTAIGEWSYNLTNPCIGVRRAKQKEGRIARLTREQQRYLLEAAQAVADEHDLDWLPLIIRLALTTAMRQGEIRLLRWDYIIDGGRIELPGSVTKTASGRTIPLTREGRRVVADIRDALHGKHNQRLGYVWGIPDEPAQNGGFTADQISYWYRQAMKKAVRRHGIPSLTFHDLRHVAITRLTHFYSSPMDLAKTTGHKGVGMLMRYYNPSAEEQEIMVRAHEDAMMAGSADAAAAIMATARARCAAIHEAEDESA